MTQANNTQNGYRIETVPLSGGTRQYVVYDEKNQVVIITSQRTVVETYKNLEKK
jgi:hypothetical protein